MKLEPKWARQAHQSMDSRLNQLLWKAVLHDLSLDDYLGPTVFHIYYMIDQTNAWVEAHAK